MKTIKIAKVTKPYAVKVAGFDFVVPIGATVSNQTACGPDDSYRFWQDWKKQAQQVTGFKNSICALDLEYYGVNVPAEHCEAYPA